MKRSGGAGAASGGTAPRRRGRGGNAGRGSPGDGTTAPSREAPDPVEEAGRGSFPASDPPPWTPRVALGPPSRPATPASTERHRPAIERALSGESLLFHLDDELKTATNPDILARSGRTARTLAKDESLRVSMHVVAGGGSIDEHHAEGPITVQVLRGAMRLQAGEQAYDLREGDLLALSTAVPHSIHSREGAAFLLTVSLAGSAGRD